VSSSGGKFTIKFGTQDPLEDVATSFHVVMKTYGWDIFTLKKTPIPTFLGLLREIQKENKEAEKEMKKAKSKKR
jgi:hypothetical protein